MEDLDIVNKLSLILYIVDEMFTLKLRSDMFLSTDLHLRKAKLRDETS